MSTILTQKYKHLIEKEGLDRVLHMGLSAFPLLIDVAKSGKLRELISFTIWELLHRVGLFRKKKYLQFTNGKPLIIAKEQELSKLDLSKYIQELPFVISNTVGWKLLYQNSQNNWFGCLAQDDRSLYTFKNSSEPTKLHTFDKGISSIYITDEDILFVNTWGSLYKSLDYGKTFEKSLSLTEEESYIFHHNGMTQLPDGTLLIGEYGNVPKDGKWMNLAYVYESKDSGETWVKSDFLIQQGINKHVHLIKYSKVLNAVMLADGDNKKKLWIAHNCSTFDLMHSPWKLVNHFHIQIGGYTSMVETDDIVYLGTDYLGGTNFLVSTKNGKYYNKSVIPDPYRRSPLMNMIKRKSRSGNYELWAILHNPISSNARCLLMCSLDDGESWNRVIEYDGTEYEIQISSASVN
ncbi:MAG: glycoside hydrolase, partial [Epsilonproteobacteria bacterium]|nr:glycoside hydrolase [Campylobacterota bacterium]